MEYLVTWFRNEQEKRQSYYFGESESDALAFYGKMIKAGCVAVRIWVSFIPV